MEGTFLWQPLLRKNGGFLPSTSASSFLHEDRGIFVCSRHFFPYLIVWQELVAIQVVAPMHACRPCHQDCLSRVNSIQARTCSSFVSPESAKDVSVDFPELLNHTGKHINSSTFSIPTFFLSCFQVRSKGGLSGLTPGCIYVAHTIPAVGQWVWVWLLGPQLRMTEAPFHVTEETGSFLRL